MKLLKPPALLRGDTIGIVAPASPVKRNLLTKGVKELHRLGYRAVLGEHVLERRSFFAGEHRERAQDLLAFLEEPEIQAIFCARGGYGSNYVVEYLSRPAVLRRLRHLPPRIVMGYSDISTVLLFLYQKLGWITFQGPMVTKDFAHSEAGYNRRVFERVLSRASVFTIPSDAFAVRKGTAEGRLTGGCLSLLVTTLGTPNEIDTHGAILLLEDVDEKPYQIDRLLRHMKEAGKFRGVKGVVFGEMVGCGLHSSPAKDLGDVIEEAFAGMNMPIAFGMRFGHTSGGSLTLPIGVRVRLSAKEKVRLTLLEPAVKGAEARRARA